LAEIVHFERIHIMTLPYALLRTDGRTDGRLDGS